jgi:hypothetical protein
MLSVRLPVCSLSVSSEINSFNQMVHFYKIQQGGHDIEDGLDAVHFNPVASAILK